MKIKRYKNDKKEKIRTIVGLPNEDDFPITRGIVCDDLENTIGYESSNECISCEQSSIEVNADHQSVIDEAQGPSGASQISPQTRKSRH